MNEIRDKELNEGVLYKVSGGFSGESDDIIMAGVGISSGGTGVDTFGNSDNSETDQNGCVFGSGGQIP